MPARAPGWCSATSSRDTLGLDPAHLATLLDDTSVPSWSSTTPASRATSRHPAGAGGPARHHPHRGQRPRALRHLARPAPGQHRPVRRAELPRDQELHLRRGRGAAPQRRRGRRPRAGPLRQGHQPPGVPARPGRQVLLEGHRLVLRPLRRAGRLPPGPARAARRRSRRSGARSPSTTTRRWRRTPSGSASRRCPRTRPSGSRRTTCSTSCCRTSSSATRCSPGCATRGAGHLPLRAAAHLGRRPHVRGARDRVPGDHRHQRAAAAAALPQQPHGRRPRPGRRRPSSTSVAAGAA